MVSLRQEHWNEDKTTDHFRPPEQRRHALSWTTDGAVHCALRVYIYAVDCMRQVDREEVKAAYHYCASQKWRKCLSRSSGRELPHQLRNRTMVALVLVRFLGAQEANSLTYSATPERGKCRLPPSRGFHVRHVLRSRGQRNWTDEQRGEANVQARDFISEWAPCAHTVHLRALKRKDPAPGTKTWNLQLCYRPRVWWFAPLRV